MKVHGKILAVTTRPVGAEVSQASTGTLVRVRDASMFDTTGGTLSLDGVEYAYVTADPDDEAGDSVTLAAPLTVEEGDRLAIVPVKQEVVATVRVWDDAEPVPAVVPLELKPLLLEGVRSDQATAETVKVDWRDGDPIVAEVVGQRASIDAAYISNAEELLLEDQKTLGEKLAEAAAARAEAAEQLAEAEQRLNDAFSEIELLPDDAYVAAAKQQAIDAAAITAQQKADAAEAAAKTYADQQAAAAEANAKAFATTRTDGLAKTLWSTALPGTTTAPKDSVWYRVDASGKIIAVYTQTASPSGASWSARPITSEAIDNLDVGKLTAASGTVNDLVANVFAAKLADLIEANIGNLTVTGDAHLNNVVAQRIWGDLATFARITADQVLAGNIAAVWSITTGGKIVAGDPAGARVEMTDGGIDVYVIGPNGSPYRATRLSGSEISIGIMGQDGTRLAGITSMGDVTGVTAAFDKALAVRGRSMLGRVAGELQPGWLDLLPRGLVGGTAATTLAVSAKPAGQEHVYLKGAWTLESGRRYRITGRFRAQPGTVGGVVRGRIRGLRGTSDPTTSSEELDLVNSAQGYNAATQVNVDMEAIYTPSLGGEHRFGIFYQGLNNSTPAPRWARLYVEDVGPSRADLGGGGEGEATKVLYQTSWTATASRIYRDTNAGAAIAGTDGKIETFYWRGEPKEFNSSAVLFAGGATEADSSLELGKTLPQALNGATLHSIEVELRNKVTYGGLDEDLIRLGLGTLGGSSLPSSATIEATVYADGIAEGSTARVAVPTSWFTNGANRGITVGDRDAKMDSGAGVKFLTGAVWHGPQDSDPPRIHVVYSR